MRLLAMLVVAVGALAGVLIPSPADSPLGRVASIDGDASEPRWDTPVDGAAVRRAGELLPDDARYYVWAPGASPLLQGNLKSAAQLFLAPALPVQEATEGEWILSYRASATLPDGVRGAARRSVGPRVVLVRVRR
jgi:hypothetical protein